MLDDAQHPSDAMLTEQERLFLRTLEDLERRIEDSDPYEILGASALIRKLLLDEHPLVDQVNRDYKRKITFEVGKPPELPPGIPKPVFSTIQDGIDPDTMPPSFPRAKLNREQFLKTVLSTVGGHEYTLRETVLFEANVMGGVHSGSPKEEKEKALQGTNSMIAVGGYRSSLRQLKAIGRVVLKALRELREDVSKEASQQ